MGGLPSNSRHDADSEEEYDPMKHPSEPPSPSIRPLNGRDLNAIVAIDKAVSGRSRRGFYQRRLGHLAREPSAFVALGADRDGKLVGFVFARLYEGEFGGKVAEATLDAIGVAAEARHQGVGRTLLNGMMETMRRHGVTEIATEIDWTDTDLTGFLADAGFLLAPRIVLERAVGRLDAR
jgi:GNAT superfamily N-acetyltransferase